MRRPSVFSAVLAFMLVFVVSACHDSVKSVTAKDDSVGIAPAAALPTHNAVANQVPVANAGGPYTGLEGSPVALSASGSSDPDGDPLNYEWVIGTACVSTPQLPKDCTPFLQANTTYTWPQNGTFTVQVKVSDGFGGTSTASAPVTISNVPPSVDSLDMPSQILVGTTVSLRLRLKDPGVSDAPWFVNIAWGDGSQTGVNVTTIANALTFTHKYTIAGRLNVAIAVADKDNGIGRASRAIEVATTLGNTPTGTSVSVQPADPSGAKPLTVTFPTVTVAGNTTLGTRQINAAAPGVRFGSAPVLYDLATTAQYTAPVKVCLTYDPARFGRPGVPKLMMLNGDTWTDVTTDASTPGTVCGESATVGTYAVALVNGIPTAALAAVAGINEGGSVTFDATGSADPDGDAVTYVWSFGDGSPSETTTQPTVTHSYGDNGTFTTSLVVRDQDAAVSEPATASVIVENLPPSASFSAPVMVNEGSAIALSLSGATDPSAEDRAAGFSYAFDCGIGYGPWTRSASVSCPATDNGSRTVRGKLRDKDGGEHAYEAVVSIANLPPILGALQGPAGSVKKRTEVSVRGTFSDEGSADTHSATISWGDGSSSAATIAGGVASGAHTYNTAGTYAVSMVVTDKDGGRSEPSTLQIVVTNGNGGNGGGKDGDDGTVTLSGSTVGTGWIVTDTKVNKKGQQEIEKGVFGFEAKAKRGRRDECEAVLGFHSRAVDFKATSCGSFLVSGTKAVVKGVGRLDHERGTYSYVLCVIDAGGRREDRMHLRIWNTATGRVVFDNQPGAALDAAEKKIGDGRIYVRDR